MASACPPALGAECGSVSRRGARVPAGFIAKLEQREEVAPDWRQTTARVAPGG